MMDSGVKAIVFSSSCATYGIPLYLPITEDHIQQPINPYGASKLFIEDVLRWYGQAYRLRFSILRYFNAAEADPDGALGESHDPETHLIPLAIAAQGRIPHVQIFGTDYDTSDGSAVRDFVHVSDLADVHVRATDQLLDGATGAILNLGAGTGWTVREVIRSVELVGGRPVPIIEAPRRAGDPAALVTVAEHVQAALAWKPRLSDLATIVETVWRWHERPAFTGKRSCTVELRG
jgi:UDP-arabinose 4-epimerase